METVAVDYQSQEVEFYYIYKALAHPEHNGYVQPFTQEERLLHVAEAKRTLGSEIEWLCDNMKNELKQALGGAPNSQFVIDPKGKIIHASGWSNPVELRRVLANLVGEVTPATTVADLDLKQLPPPQLAGQGFAVRPEMPGQMRALLVKPLRSGEQYYVKLRAEVDSRFMQEGLGWMYIGFHLDPLLRVHWNNLAPPLKFRISTPEGITVALAEASARKIEVESDADPREFLLGIEWDSNVLPAASLPASSLVLEVEYYPCHEKGWCKFIKQSYTIKLQPDRNAGSVRSRGRAVGGQFRNR